MLTAKNIHKSFGSLQVLKGIDVEISKGELVAIVGPSGAGKTTLLQILGTLDKPDEGNIIIQNTDLAILKGEQLALFRNRKIGFIFQFHHLLPEFTGLENVCLPGWISGKNKKEVISKASELLNYLGLSEREHHKPSELSGGEQQRVAVARALINQPEIVFADEPSGNLDSQTAKELHQLFLRLNKDFQQTFVIVTHNPELAGLCHRRITLVDGRVVGTTTL
ncbi:MAG: lipoprotein ABC transporter ATP-binding protein [Bacteroidetes bacterium RIFCSPLOWO2_02_FULL_36_8]|nr:MAG: lipoprotein ABC transporter ATP-binding protein [Bacteroidetes bacterium RIFCSPLOWO2_02_FULL_36_8]OFY71159.1 MAG: lipoprotein ABC transporter ATP-binding protein [Bacteroidetes bacterium RIFCSPLOWO2_12_FULL_37_12]